VSKGNDNNGTQGGRKKSFKKYEKTLKNLLTNAKKYGIM
jgi:hypothetical protein